MQPELNKRGSDWQGWPLIVLGISSNRIADDGTAEVNTRAARHDKQFESEFASWLPLESLSSFVKILTADSRLV